VAALHIYPVKSCAGHSVSKAELTTTGFRYDRLWMVLNSSNRFVTQRRLPKMAHVRPSLPKADDEPLMLTAPGMNDISVPVLRAKDKGAKILEVWSSTCDGVDQGDAVAAWLTSFLGGGSGDGEAYRLVRMDEAFRRPVDPDFGGRGHFVSFADGFPMLWASQESLEEVNRRLGEPIPMNRFRPNVVVTGSGPFCEDEWTEMRVNGIIMRPVKPCSRCKIPTIDQKTLATSNEPTETLRTFR
ncbi:unnamed protein product, partial [Phaeothamnion confervicola]